MPSDAERRAAEEALKAKQDTEKRLEDEAREAARGPGRSQFFANGTRNPQIYSRMTSLCHTCAAKISQGADERFRETESPKAREDQAVQQERGCVTQPSLQKEPHLMSAGLVELECCVELVGEIMCVRKLGI